MTLLRIILLLLLLWPSSVAAQSAGTNPLPDPTRAPVVRVGFTLRTMLVASGMSLRVEIEPVRDVIGICYDREWTSTPSTESAEDDDPIESILILPSFTNRKSSIKNPPIFPPIT